MSFSLRQLTLAVALCGILAPIVFDLPIPSGAAIILVAGIAFALAALARGVVPSLKGNLG